MFTFTPPCQIIFEIAENWWAIAMKILRNIVSGAVVLSTLFSAASPMAMTIDDGRYYFRYKGLQNSNTPVSPDSTLKDIRAFYIGGLGQPFAEELPMKPDWQNDNWVQVEGQLPPGLTFDASTRRFIGTPTSLGTFNVDLVGYDHAGSKVAAARASFTIKELPENVIEVDLYAHTGKFFNRSLDLPKGVVVQEWEEIAQAPPGMSVNGRYIEGTPSQAGQYPILNIGYNYNGEAIFAYLGKLIVEDGPTFPVIPDDLRAVERQISAGCGPGAECAYWFDQPLPVVRHSLGQPNKVQYSYELASGESLPTGLTLSQRKWPSPAFYKYGTVFEFYDQANIRLRAEDIDGTVGYSNWFKVGTLGPKEVCQPQDGVAFIPLQGVVGQAFLGNTYKVPVGNNVGGGKFEITTGELPQGLLLNEQSGVFSGTPTREELKTGITVRVSYPSNPQIEPVICGPYRVDIAAAAFGLSAAYPGNSQNYHTGMDLNLRLKPTGALLSGYDLDILPESSNLPEEVKLTKIGASEWKLDGILQTVGHFSATARLTNGNGKVALSKIAFEVKPPIKIENVPNNRLEIRQYDSTGQDISFHKFTYENTFGPETLGLVGSMTGISIDGPDIIGGTTLPIGSYGPFKTVITDSTGETAATDNYQIVVTQRRGITGELVGALDYVVNKPVDQVPYAVDQEALAAATYSLTYSISPQALPEGLTFNTATGRISGTPTMTGVYPGYMITATETGAANGTTATSEPFAITVKEPDEIGVIKLAKLEGNRNGVNISSIDPRNELAKIAARLVGSVNDVRYLSANPRVPGLTLNRLTGQLTGTPTVEFKGDVLVEIEDLAGRSGKLMLPVAIYPYPALSSASPFEVPRLSLAEDFGVKIVPNAGFFAGQTFTLSPQSPQTLPTGMILDAATGAITGKTTLPAPSERNVIVRAVSAANGITVDLPVTVRIVEQRPMVLDIPDGVVATYRRNEATGKFTEVPRLSLSSFLSGSYASPVAWTLNNAPAWMTINRDTGMLGFLNAPSTLGKRTVEVVVTDAEETSVKETLNILLTMDGFVLSQTGSGSVVVRQNEMFEFPQQTLTNVVPPYLFSATGAAAQDLLLNSKTGLVRGEFTTAGYRDWKLKVTDTDGRGFEQDLVFEADVIAPLEFDIPAKTVTNSTQYSPTNQIFLAFPALKHAIGSIAFLIDGDMPGTLYYKSTSSTGLATYQHYSSGGGVTTVIQKANETLEQTEARLADDRIIFDREAMTLVGFSSKQGTFPFYLAANDSHEQNGYQINPNEATRATYNNAESGPYTINVAAKPSMQLVASTGIPRHMIVNTQDANMTITAQNPAYGVASWNVSGALPTGVTYKVADGTLKFSGTASVIGLYPNIMVTAIDKRGAQAQLNFSFNVIQSPDPIVLNVADIRTKVGYPIVMGAPYAANSISTSNTYGNLLFQSAEAKALGIIIDPKTGELTGKGHDTGDFTFNVSVTDDTNRITSRAVKVEVIPNLRVLTPSIVTLERGVVQTQTVSTDYAIGAVSYRKGAGDWPIGLSVDPSDGSISGTITSPVGDYEGLTIIGRDAAGDQQASNVFTIEVVPMKASPVISNVPSNQLNMGFVNVASTPFTPTVVDSVYGQPWNDPDSVFTLNKPLPDGLSIDAKTGKISGTPTEAKTVSGIVITVTTKTGKTSSTSPFTVTVSNISVVKSDEAVTLGFPIKPTLPAFTAPSGLSATYQYIGLPAGLTFNATTGALSGEPTVAGVYQVKLRTTVTGYSSPIVLDDTFIVDVGNHASYKVQITKTRENGHIACFADIKVFDQSGADITRYVSIKQTPGTSAYIGPVDKLLDGNVGEGSFWCGMPPTTQESSFIFATGGRDVGSMKFFYRSGSNDSFPQEWNLQRKSGGGAYSQIMSIALPYDPDMRGKVYTMQ